ERERRQGTHAGAPEHFDALHEALLDVGRGMTDVAERDVANCIELEAGDRRRVATVRGTAVDDDERLRALGVHVYPQWVRVLGRLGRRRRRAMRRAPPQRIKARLVPG